MKIKNKTSFKPLDNPAIVVKYKNGRTYGFKDQKYPLGVRECLDMAEEASGDCIKRATIQESIFIEEI